MEQICPTVNGISAVSELNEGGEGWRKRGEGRGVRLGETDKHIKTASLPATHLLFTLLQLNCVSLNTHSPSAPVHTAIHLHALLHRFTQTLSNKQTKVHTHSCVCMYAHTHTTHVHAHTHTNTKKYPQHTWIQAEKNYFFSLHVRCKWTSVQRQTRCSAERGHHCRLCRLSMRIKLQSLLSELVSPLLICTSTVF